jgi:hypothetical protein
LSVGVLGHHLDQPAIPEIIEGHAQIRELDLLANGVKIAPFPRSTIVS